ncbi:Epoxide hydrolase 1 [Toxocara canis]|uniref:Epoxide hydrolase n=1 Tax=Toxocara canis TaxID=6265 RepID=A0A0B2VCM0_TOXCA|nr:Epoxide hydrolase 1 [Toxocara canis]
MGSVFQLLFTISIAIVAYNVYVFLQKPAPKLEIDNDGWYGSGQKRADKEAIVAFQVNVPDDVLQDLRMRLQNTRISHEPLEDSDNFEYGFNANFLRTVIRYWAEKFDWRKQEAIINRFPQFTTEIEGLKVHFIRAKPPAKKYSRIVPLLIVHGWPGNVFEFYKIIPMLTDPSSNLGLESSIAFEVIAPSIPGYGWSDASRKTGFNQWSTARIFRKLMLRLGHNKFLLQGGDWGSLVCTNIALYYPQNVLGLHLNMAFMTPYANPKTMFRAIVGSIAPSAVFSSPKAYSFNLKNLFFMVLAESGYLHLQATDPDSVGTGLNDSPVGLAAYILNKFAAWTNRHYRSLPDGGLTQKFTMDELLTILSIYWINGNIVNSQRYYKEFFLSPQRTIVESAYLTIPTAFAAFPNELFDPPPKEMIECKYNLTSYTEMPTGGHFAALEEPKLLAEDIFKFSSILHL